MKPSLAALVDEIMALPPESKSYVADVLLEALSGGHNHGLDEKRTAEVHSYCRELDARHDQNPLVLAKWKQVREAFLEGGRGSKEQDAGFEQSCFFMRRPVDKHPDSIL